MVTVWRLAARGRNENDPVETATWPGSGAPRRDPWRSRRDHRPMADGPPPTGPGWTPPGQDPCGGAVRPRLAGARRQGSGGASRRRDLAPRRHHRRGVTRKETSLSGLGRGVPENQLRLESNGPAGLGGVIESLGEQAHRGLSKVADRLTDRGEARVEQVGPFEVVEAGQADVVGDGQVVISHPSHCRDGCLVVAIDERCRGRLHGESRSSTCWVASGVLPACWMRGRGAARLQADRPGFRPVGFASPWDAAVWAVLSQRTRMTQAAAVRRRIAERHDTTVEVHGQHLPVFPGPQRSPTRWTTCPCRR